MEARHFFHASINSFHCSATTWGPHASLPLTERKWGPCGHTGDPSRTARESGLEVSEAEPTWLFIQSISWFVDDWALFALERTATCSRLKRFRNAELSWPLAKVFTVFLCPPSPWSVRAMVRPGPAPRRVGGASFSLALVFRLPHAQPAPAVVGAFTQRAWANAANRGCFLLEYKLPFFFFFWEPVFEHAIA